MTNPIYIKKAVETKACNALLLKVNQIGTVTEAIQAAKDAYASDWGVMVSHRSGETEDVTISDIVTGLRTGQIVSQHALVGLYAALVLTYSRKRGRHVDQNAWPSSTRYCGLRKSWGATPSMQVAAFTQQSTCKSRSRENHTLLAQYAAGTFGRESLKSEAWKTEKSETFDLN